MAPVLQQQQPNACGYKEIPSTRLFVGPEWVQNQGQSYRVIASRSPHWKKVGLRIRVFVAVEEMTSCHSTDCRSINTTKPTVQTPTEGPSTKALFRQETSFPCLFQISKKEGNVPPIFHVGTNSTQTCPVSVPITMEWSPSI
jgi:hypothetical protein